MYVFMLLMKNILKMLLLMIMIFLVFSVSNAQIITDYRSNIDLNYNTAKIRTTIEIRTGDSGVSTVTIPFSFYPKNVFVYDSRSVLQHSIFQENENYYLIIHKNIEPNQTEKMNIEYEYTAIRRIENAYLFALNMELPETYNFELLIRLPTGAILSNLTEISSVFPEPDGIGSDGQRIILRWNKTNVETQDFQVLVLFETAPITTIASFSVFPIILIIILMVIILSMFFFFNKREDKIKIIGLDKNEKKIYNFIKSKKEVNQKTIQKELDFSKPRLSKLIRSLEEKELIEKKPSGRTNIIKIKK